MGNYILISTGWALKCSETPSEQLKDVHNDSKEYEPKEVECKKYDDTCVNIETTLGFKFKGCATIEDVQSVLPRGWDYVLFLSEMEIKEDECKKFPNEINNLLKAQVEVGKWILKNEKDEESREKIENRMKLKEIEGFQAYTFCTCSTDLCNGGVRIKAKTSMVVILGFIISTFYLRQHYSFLT